MPRLAEIKNVIYKELPKQQFSAYVNPAHVTSVEVSSAGATIFLSDGHSIRTIMSVPDVGKVLEESMN